MNEQVLVVDDDDAIRYTVSLILQRAGYRVSQAGDGEEGLTMIHKADKEGAPYDLVVTDVCMPRLSGCRLIELLRQAGMDLPVIVMTGVADKVLSERLSQLGCGDLFEKPFDLKEMLNRIGNILPGKGQNSLAGDRRAPSQGRSHEVAAGL